MRHLRLIVIALSFAIGCGGGSSDAASGGGAGTTAGTSGSEQGGSEQGGDASGGETQPADDQFQLSDSDDADQAHGERPSEIEATLTHAAMRLFIVDPETGPIEGIVIKLIDPDGRVFYTGESDSLGYAEVLVPVGRRYRMEYLSLGRTRTRASVEVPEGPNQDIRLTMRYRRRRPAAPPPEADAPPQPETERERERVVLEGVLFDSGRATIQAESFPQLDNVVEFMEHMPSARIRIEGHTDNVGNPQRNQALSEERAQAVRTYLMEHGIDGDRVEAVGFGDTRPVASNDTDDGRAQNRRIEAIEL